MPFEPIGQHEHCKWVAELSTRKATFFSRIFYNLTTKYHKSILDCYNIKKEVDIWFEGEDIGNVVNRDLIVDLINEEH